MKFVKNDNKYRPLNLMHDRYGFKIYTPFKVCVKRAKKEILHFKEVGYGGVGTNVYYGWRGIHYLKSKKMFKVLGEIVKFCKEQDLKVWLYDELGYPSGSAHGKVVKKYPETEAFGIACLDFNLKENQTITVKLPYNHKAFKSAVFVSEDGATDISKFANKKGSLTYTAKKEGKLYYFATKTLFEGVHATRKFASSTRYIDVLDKNAVKRFIEITYEAYKEHIGEYFGNGIEAFFTDEPSVMGLYMPFLPLKPFEKDKENKKMPLYKHVVWSRNFEAEFLNRKGYDISPYIYMLFDGEADETEKVRIDYNEVCAELYKEAYFEGIASWCSENNLKLTGHLLGEENLYEQVLNEYDNFKMLKPMQMPGIDVLTCNPKTLLEEPLLLKTTSSAAYFHNKSVVMSETGFHLDRLAKSDPTKEMALASILLQYAKGINAVASYLGSRFYTKEDYRYIFDRVAKAGQILEGGSFKVPILVYYPAKSCYKFITPSEKDRESRSYDENFMLIDHSIKNTLLTLDAKKLDYYLIDNENLTAKKANEFKGIYFSVCDFKTENIIESILELANNGVFIYLEESKFIVNELKNNNNIKIVKNAEEAVEDIYKNGLNDITISQNEQEDIAFCHKEINGKQVYMLINTVEKTLSPKVTFKETNEPYIYNINKCKKVNFNFEKCENNINIELKLEGFEALFIIF